MDDFTPPYPPSLTSSLHFCRPPFVISFGEQWRFGGDLFLRFRMHCTADYELRWVFSAVFWHAIFCSFMGFNMLLTGQPSVAVNWTDAMVANHVNTGYLEEATVAAKQEEEEEEEEDLPQSLLEELEFEDPDAGKSAKEMVRDSKELEEGEDSRLEDRIDEVAELFITRIHQQMRMQEQDSFKSLSIHPPPLRLYLARKFPETHKNIISNLMKFHAHGSMFSLMIWY
ncbi:hypothetical protein RHMOL_Rhmol02G0075600 [Rhododendron molle]|uniref:Uncharacterized protein n=1 Tax=Rhododendron molle TaxID=49168 RepID=A0ACC0PPB3_RHOML|nr:hypothetical protein RHMOL_Rhmol02G0075600 [Rhododendron molle]